MASLLTLSDGTALAATDRLYVMRDPTGTPSDIYLTGAAINEAVRDAAGAAITAGDGIAVTVSDPGDTVTVAFNGTLSTKYQPRASDSVFASAIDMWWGNVATPLFATLGAGGQKVWRLDAAIVEDLISQLILPQWWISYDLELWWTNVGPGTGNVVIQPKHFEDNINPGQNAGDGDNLAAGAGFVNTVSAITVAAPAASVLKVTTLATGITRIAGLTSVNITRVATDGGDTLTNDIGILGLNFKRAT
jgi:hypothetical protein